MMSNIKKQSKSWGLNCLAGDMRRGKIHHSGSKNISSNKQDGALIRIYSSSFSNASNRLVLQANDKSLFL